VNNWNQIFLMSLLLRGREIDPLLFFCLQGLGGTGCAPGTTAQLPCPPPCPPAPPPATTTPPPATSAQPCCCGGTQAMDPFLMLLLMGGGGFGRERKDFFPGFHRWEKKEEAK
jgi:hypothetical protein